MAEKPAPKVRRKRRLSEAEIAQRRAAAPNGALAARGKCTGPRTDEGKAASSRNRWVHGQYSAINKARFRLGEASLAHAFGKPCRTTCPVHPDNPDRIEAPCSLVLDGMTRAGASCLDRSVFANSIHAVMSAMQQGDMDGMQGVLANELAAGVQLMHTMREAIGEHGMLVGTPMIDKKGKPILDANGKQALADLKANPVLPHLIKLLDSLGINFAEVLATPAARQRAKSDEETSGGIASVLGAIMQRAQAGKPARTLEGS